MNKYIAFYNGRKIEVQAETSYAAQQEAVKQFKPSKSKAHMVHVHICEREDGSTVVHSTASL